MLENILKDLLWTLLKQPLDESLLIFFKQSLSNFQKFINEALFDVRPEVIVKILIEILLVTQWAIPIGIL